MFESLARAGGPWYKKPAIYDPPWRTMTPCGPPRRTLQSHHVPDQPPQLQYQSASAVSRRKKTNRILASIVIILVSVVLVRIGPLAFRHIRLLSMQSHCMGFRLPVDQTWPIYNLRSWDDLVSAIGVNSYGHLLFLHERSTPEGRSRLVAVEGNFMVTLDGLARLASPELAAHVIRPGDLLSEPRYIPPMAGPYPRVEMLGTISSIKSETDSQNASHFTISFETTLDLRIVVDGWLQNNETVLLEIRPAVPIPPPTSSPASSH